MPEGRDTFTFAHVSDCWRAMLSVDTLSPFPGFSVFRMQGQKMGLSRSVVNAWLERQVTPPPVSHSTLSGG